MHMTGTSHAAHQVDTLAPLSIMTHVAVKDGAWTDPNTWSTGTVPGVDANVHVPQGVTVTYDLNTEVPLGVVRVDGMLDWATNQSTVMLVETIVSTYGSQIEVGSMHDDPIAADFTAEIIFRDTPIDTATDPEMLGHGLVAFGHVDIMGAKKESFLEIAGNGVEAGATKVKLDGDLTNWEIGDTILFVGTGSGSRDEERVIVSVDGNTVSFDAPLSYAHQPPAGFDFETYVGNLSRNVIFTSENPEGVRGHVMLMNDLVDHGENANSAMFAEFTDLGRTDESIPTGTASNPAGRYPFHLHQIGTDPDSPPNMIQGIAVSGSPGWGIVQHSSNAMIADSIIYDTVGAGMVSEWGDENGMWMGNLVTSVAGTNVDDRKVGVEGAAYENQSRSIVQQDNIAANSEIGWNWFGHEEFPEDANNTGAPKDREHRKMFEREQLPYDPNPFDSAIDHEEGAIPGFDGNTSIANDVGFRVFHRQAAVDSDTLSVISDFDVWGGDSAVLLQNYAYNYEFIDSTWVGTDTGFELWIKNSSAVLNNIDMHGFDYGYKAFGVSHEAVLYEVDFHNVDTEFDIRFKQKYPGDQNWVKAYAAWGIDYMNPMPKVLRSSDLKEFSGLELVLDDDAAAVLSPGSRDLTLTGTVIDGLGERRFYENVWSSEANLEYSAEGARLRLANNSDLYFSVKDFLDVHGTFQKPDGSWVSPVVFWLTERLEGKQYPVIIEFRLQGFDQDDLLAFELDRYPAPTIDNLEWFEKNGSLENTTGDTAGGGTDGDTGGRETDGDTGGRETDGGTGGGETDGGTGGGETDGGTGGGETDGALPQSDPVWQELGGVPFGNMGDRVRVNGSAAEERTHALVFETGSDVVKTQVVYEQGGSVRGLNFVIENGRLYAALWNKAEEDWGYKELSANIEANMQYTSVLVMDGQLPSNGTATLYLNGVAVDTVSGIGKLYEHPDDIGVGQIAQSTLVHDTVQTGKLKFEGSIETLLHYDRALDSSEVGSLSALGGGTDGDTAGGGTDGDTAGGDEISDRVELVGTTRHDTLNGSDADDIIFGLDGRDTIYGGGGDDIIVGGGDQDKIYGGDGNDILDGGDGNDWLSGGAGADVFRFSADALDGFRKSVLDFSIAEGDVLDLSPISQAYGLTADEMREAVSFRDIDVGMRVTVELDGTLYRIAALHDIETVDFLGHDLLLV